MKRANRILLLVTQADWGGVQSFLVRFALQLQAEGRTVLLASGGEGALWDEAQRAGIPTKRLQHMVREINIIEDWKAIKEIQNLIVDFKPDAVHLNSSKMGVLGSIACLKSTSQKLSPHVVYRIGGWAFLEPLPEWKRWIYQMSEKVTAKYKDIIITVNPSDELLARELHIIPRKKVVTIPNGLEAVSFISKLKTRAEARATLGIPQNAFVFGTVANAYATKGLIPYLTNFERIKKENSNVYAVIIGDGPEQYVLNEHKILLGLEDRLILTGQRQDATTLYSAFDVFVLPSRKEGMPWTLLEAMCAGIPVIATDVGACRWMIAQTNAVQAGLIVPKEDNNALCDAMRTLLHDAPRRESLGLGGKTNVLQRFTWSATYQGHRDALDQV